MRRLGLVVAVVASLATPVEAVADVSFAAGFGSAGSADGQFQGAFGIASSPSGDVYVTDEPSGRVQRFTGEGAFVQAFPSPAPRGIAMNQQGDVYVVDGSGRVQAFTAEGASVTSWGTPGSLEGQFNDPQFVAVDRSGEVLVTDAGNGRVQRFTGTGAFVATIGGPGTGNGQFTRPAGIATDLGGSVYVADAGSNSVQKFNRDGSFVSRWGSQGAGSGQLDRPAGVAVDSAGNVLVADSGNGRIAKYTAEGAFLETVGSGGPGAGQFNAPTGVATDPSGAIFVADRGNARVQRLSDSAIAAQVPPTSLPPPILGQTVNAAVVRGVVRVRLPGSRRFVRLTADRTLRVGSLIDATRGRVRLITARDASGALQAGDFSAGAFVFRQEAAAGGLTRLRLALGDLRRCPRTKRGGSRLRAGTAAKRRRKKPGRKLFGKSDGNFETDGTNAAATTRGTAWLTQDRCDGTLVRVSEGTVSVRDKVRRRTVIVRAGEQYLARRR